MIQKWSTWVGLRYTRARRRKRFIHFVAWMSTLGVGIGVTSLIVVLSVMGGFERELKKRLLSAETHLLVQGETSEAGADVASELSKMPEVTGVHGVLSSEVILRHGRRVAGVVLKGWEPARLQALRSKLVESSRLEGASLNHIWVGKELAYSLGLMPGDFVTLVSPIETVGPLEVAPRVMRFEVEGIYQAGSPDQELTTLWATQGAVREFLRKPVPVTTWEAQLREPEDSTRILGRLKLPSSVTVKDWKELNASLFASLKLERWAMFVVLIFIVLVASFNIVSTLSMTVVEKRKELSILRAIGAVPRDLRRIVWVQGAVIGGLGITGGVAVGGALVHLLRRYEFIRLPEIYVDRNLPVVVDPWVWFGIAFSAAVVVLVAAWIPAQRALGISPMEGISQRK